jgi:hypothetical protein
MNGGNQGLKGKMNRNAVIALEGLLELAEKYMRRVLKHEQPLNSDRDEHELAKTLEAARSIAASLPEGDVVRNALITVAKNLEDSVR